jgi:mycothiol synthase
VAYEWRGLTHADTASWSRLTAAIAAADGTGEVLSAADLAEELDSPDHDPARDTVAVLDEDGEVVAYGQVDVPLELPDGSVRIRVQGDIHPDHRGVGIGTELLRRLEARARERLAEHCPGRSAQVRVPVNSPDAAALLEASGYRAVRWYHSMSRPLRTTALERPPLPPGVRLGAYSSELDAAVHDAHLDAFAGHWDYAPPSPDRWQFWFTGARSFRPSCSVLATTDDATVVGYALAYEFQAGEIYLGHIGVRSRMQGHGLGRAVTLQALRAAAAEGYRLAKLDVDSGNPTGAGRLYETVGFVRDHTTAIFERVEPLTT